MSIDLNIKRREKMETVTAGRSFLFEIWGNYFLWATKNSDGKQHQTFKKC